jgi:MFS family permease
MTAISPSDTVSTPSAPSRAPRQWAPLAVLGAAQFLMVLDTAVMNVSISQLVDDFDTDVTTIQAVITSYALVMAALMLVGAKLGDRIGRRRAFAIGIAVYGLGSALTAAAPTVPVLMIGWSFLEGSGAALVLPALVALVASTYEGRARALAYAVLGGLAGAGVAVGPLLGGWITEVATWRLVFVGEVAIVLAILASIRRIPVAPAQEPTERFDVAGAVLSASGITLVVLGILQAGTWGWLVPRRSPVEPLGFSLTPFVVVAGVVTLWAFTRWERGRERRGQEPLVRLDLLRVPTLRSGLATLAAQNLILLGLFFAIPLYLQIVLGLGALDTGIRLVPVSITMLIAALSGPALGRIASPRAIVRAGFASVLTAALLLLVAVSPGVAGVWFTVAMAVLGVGVGLIASQLGNVIQSSVGEGERSEVGGLQYTAQNVGSALGTALIGTIVLGALASSASGALSTDDRISEPVRQQVEMALESGISFVPADDLEAALRDAGVDIVEAAVLADDYTESQFDGLRAAFLAVAALAAAALLLTGGLPDRRLVGDRDPGRATDTDLLDPRAGPPPRRGA